MDLSDQVRIPPKHKISSAEVEAKILACGLRMTQLRRIILGILINAQEHLNVAQIHSLATLDKNFFALASVYRNINMMVEIGLIASHQFKSGQSYYELADSNPHDHLIDLNSGQIIEFRNTALDRLKVQIAKEYGYRAEDCHIEFYAHPIESRSSQLGKFNTAQRQS